MADVLHVVPVLWAQPPGDLARLGTRLSRVFGVHVTQRTPTFDPDVAFDEARGQTNSRLLLAQLLRDTPDGSGRILGVTGVDLFIPVLTFVFGEAQLGGRAAVVSTYRLDSQRYGLPPAPEVLFERLCKEAIHELGHTYELVHCRDSGCVMASSTNVDGIDLKSADFCVDCQRSLTGTGSSITGR